MQMHNHDKEAITGVSDGDISFDSDSDDSGSACESDYTQETDCTQEAVIPGLTLSPVVTTENMTKQGTAPSDPVTANAIDEKTDQPTPTQHTQAEKKKRKLVTKLPAAPETTVQLARTKPTRPTMLDQRKANVHAKNTKQEDILEFIENSTDPSINDDDFLVRQDAMLITDQHKAEKKTGHGTKTSAKKKKKPFTVKLKNPKTKATKPTPSPPNQSKKTTTMKQSDSVKDSLALASVSDHDHLDATASYANFISGTTTPEYTPLYASNTEAEAKATVIGKSSSRDQEPVKERAKSSLGGDRKKSPSSDRNGDRKGRRHKTERYNHSTRDTSPPIGWNPSPVRSNHSSSRKRRRSDRGTSRHQRQTDSHRDQRDASSQSRKPRDLRSNTNRLRQNIHQARSETIQYSKSGVVPEEKKTLYNMIGALQVQVGSIQSHLNALSQRHDNLNQHILQWHQANNSYPHSYGNNGTANNSLMHQNQFHSQGNGSNQNQIFNSSNHNLSANQAFTNQNANLTNTTPTIQAAANNDNSNMFY